MHQTTAPLTRQQRIILLIASMVSSLVMLDSNVVAVALPTIASSLGASFADIQWVVTAYVLPFAALLLAAGSFGDLYGRRRAALLGLAIFAGASLLCGTAGSPLALNLARALQGLGASLLLTASLAVINHSFQGPARARAYAFWGASLGIAITCGPIIGGVIASTVGWHWAFLINLPICALLMVATMNTVPESRDPDATSLDWAGVLTFSSGLFLLTWAVIDGNALGWTAPAVLWRAAGGLLLLAAFYVVERAQARPMLDFAILGSPTFAGSAAAMVGYAGGAQIMIFYLPLYLQNTYGYAAFTAGVAMLPFALPMFFAPRLSVRLAARYSPRDLLSLGLAVTTLADVAMALLAPRHAGYPGFGLVMMCAGFGAGLLNGETAKALQGSVPVQRAGMASGLSATVRFSALLLCVAAMGAVLVAAAIAHFAPFAPGLQLDAPTAVALAKRFAAGDTGGALAQLPPALRSGAETALRDAFDTGFGITAWTAAALTALMLAATRRLLPHGAPAPAAAGDALVVPGE